tara:strand:- start:2303 stop:3658 length:1356 start_codon:yes stop_codon:yes gene_type:complete
MILYRHFLFFLISINLSFSNSIQDRYNAVATRIIKNAQTDSTAYKRLEYLCDTYGPRLSGSKNLERSIEWILKKMKQDGLENVKGQRVKVPTWVRGHESAMLIKPFKRNLSMLGLGGSIATPKKGITSEVIVVNTFDELKIKEKKIKGNIVLFNVPFTTYGETVSYRFHGASKAASFGAKASLVRSIGPWSMNTPHTGVMAYDEKYPKIPNAAITMEDAMMLGRLYDRGEKITIKLYMEAQTLPERWSKNIISELVGSTFPDEVIVIGGHIDSWDVGQGVHDDAGGCIAAWEALRLIKKLGLKPKRTIRCVLWTNEENGSRGNQAYRDMVREKIDNQILAIESDAGVFAPKGFGFTGSDKARTIVSDIHKLLEPIDAQNISDGGRAVDIAPLNDLGVPVMSLKVDDSKYFWYHHSEADTFDKVKFDDFNNCIAAMTVMAYVVADMPEKLPR